MTLLNFLHFKCAQKRACISSFGVSFFLKVHVYRAEGFVNLSLKRKDTCSNWSNITHNFTPIGSQQMEQEFGDSKAEEQKLTTTQLHKYAFVMTPMVVTSLVFNNKAWCLRQHCNNFYLNALGENEIHKIYFFN